MKHSREYNAFTELVDRVIAVPRSIIKERVEEHRKRVDENPNRRGPKRKSKTSASGHGSNGHS
jgi:hypothetical protein